MQQRVWSEGPGTKLNPFKPDGKGKDGDEKGASKGKGKKGKEVEAKVLLRVTLRVART